MFQPRTQKIAELAAGYQQRVQEFDALLTAPAHVYVDYANVRPWARKLGWHVELKRLKQFLDSFDVVKAVHWYYGTLVGDRDSERLVDEARRLGYDVHTKPVKVITISIDVSSVSPESPDILKQFIRIPLLEKLPLAAIIYLNQQLSILNVSGVRALQDLKCNFDVEIGRDMLIDEQSDVETFLLWSGDSDFVEPVRQLLRHGRNVLVCATARHTATELNVLRQDGLRLFDIRKIKDFICWNKEIAKGTPSGAPKH